jgi:hypothetical protein
MKKFAPFFLLALPIFIFWYLFFKYALDAPLWDDFALIDFVVKINSQSLSFIQKLQLFFAQHNAHRIVYDRFIVYLIYLLSGKLNFVWMMLLGNLSLMGLIVIFYKNTAAALAKQTRIQSIWYVLPVPFWLLSLQGYENTFWGMAALQNYSILLWVGLVLYLVAHQKSIVWAMFWGVVATITSGNGMFVFLIAGLVLLVQQASTKTLIGWFLVSFCTIFAYFLTYQRLPQEVLSAKFIINFFSFLGSTFADGTANYKIPFGIGLLLFGAFSILFLRDFFLKKIALVARFSKSQLFIYSFVAFLMISALLVATSHKEGLPMQETLVSRYKIYSHLLIICLYLLLVVESKFTKLIQWSGLLLGVIFYVYAHFQSFEEMSYRRRDASVSAFNFTQNNSCLMGISHAEATNKILRNLDSLNLYKPLKIIDLPTKYIVEDIQLDTSHFKSKLPYYTPLVNTIRIENKDYQIEENNANDGPYLVMKSDQKTYLFNAHYNSNGRKGFFTTGRHYRKGFWFEVHTPLLAPAVYTLGMLNIKNNMATLVLTKTIVQIKPESMP